MDPIPDGTQQTRALHLERTFDCDRETLWKAWTEPELFARWISPFPDLDAEVHELDPEPGGRIRFTMVGPDGTRYPEQGVFEAVEPPRKLVQFQANEHRDDIFEGYPMRMTVHLEAQAGRTRLLLDQQGFPPSVPIDQAREGMEACLDKLAEIVEREGARG